MTDQFVLKYETLDGDIGKIVYDADGDMYVHYRIHDFSKTVPVYAGNRLYFYEMFKYVVMDIKRIIEADPVFVRTINESIFNQDTDDLSSFYFWQIPDYHRDRYMEAKKLFSQI